jgi:hypothetical protein
MSESPGKNYKHQGGEGLFAKILDFVSAPVKIVPSGRAGVEGVARCDDTGSQKCQNRAVKGVLGGAKSGQNCTQIKANSRNDLDQLRGTESERRTE